MRKLRFLPQTAVNPAARLASLTAIVTTMAAFSPTPLPADTQSKLSAPNPTAFALASAQRAQEPKFRFIYCDDAEIDGLSEFMRFLLYAAERYVL